MEPIKRTYNIGAGMLMEIKVIEGTAIGISNDATRLREMCQRAKNEGHDVEWNFRNNAMIEHFKGSPEEYIARLDKDFGTAIKKQKEAIEWAKENKK